MADYMMCGRRCPRCMGFMMTGEMFHQCTDHKAHVRSRSEPAGPPALDHFRPGGSYGDGPVRGCRELGNTDDQVNVDDDLPLEPPKTPRIPQTRFRLHRRRSAVVTRQELASVFGDVPSFSHVEDSDDESDASDLTIKPVNPEDNPEFEELNRAFRRASMSLSNGVGMPNSAPGSGMFTNYMDNSPGTPNISGIPRQTPSPSTPHTAGQVNGGGGMAGMNAGMPMNAGHQMDLNHLYEMVLELSEVLKNNREMTKGIITSAEEVMRRATSEGASPNLQHINGEISAGRIAELERALVKEKRLVEILKHEQVENTKLIGEYETAVGTMVEQIRNYCHNNTMHFLAQKRHYNNLLQAERDSHLESRLDRDHWHAMTMKCAEMIRTAYRLRCEEEDVPIRVVAGLQNEVRAYRNALGMEPEKPEEEYGWEILKDVPPSVD